MHRQFIWKLLAAHLGVAVSAFGMHRQFIQKLLAVQLGVAVSSFGMYRQFIWKFLAVHLAVAVTSFGMYRQFTGKLLAVDLGVAGSSFGMYRHFIWKSWAPKMGRGKMLVLRGKMFGPWTAKGVLRGFFFEGPRPPKRCFTCIFIVFSCLQVKSSFFYEIAVKCSSW